MSDGGGRYYGNAAAETEPAEVWPPTLGYEAVLHFAGTLDDATGPESPPPPACHLG